MVSNITEIPSGTVIVGVDGSRSAARALAWATDQANAEGRALTLVHATSPMDMVSWEAAAVDPSPRMQSVQVEGQAVLAAATALATRRAPGIEIHEVLRISDPRILLLELATHAAMVVLGSRGRGPVRSLLLGSVGVALTRHASCPVVIHRPHHPGTVRRGVLVGVDGTEASLPALEFGFAHASQSALPLTVLHSFWDAQAAVAGPHRVDTASSEFDQQRLLVAESVAGLGEKYPDVRVSTELVRGQPGDSLVREGSRMNLLVVGAHHGGMASEIMFGSVATTVVEHARCPVAVVPTRQA